MTLLCERHLEPFLGVEALIDRNAFRTDELYVSEVDECLRPRLPFLNKIFERFCKHAAKKVHGVCPRGLRMSVTAWDAFVDWSGLITLGLTKREARLCFCWARMRTADEVKTRHIFSTMDSLDFLEALARAAGMVQTFSGGELIDGGPATATTIEVEGTNSRAATPLETETPQESPSRAQPEPLHRRLKSMLDAINYSLDQRFCSGELGGKLSLDSRLVLNSIDEWF